MRKKITSFLYILLPFIVITLIFNGYDYFCLANNNQDKEIVVSFKDGHTETRRVREDAVEKTLNDLNKKENIEFAEINYSYQASMIPSDVLYENQWYLQKIGAQEAWNIKKDAPGRIIAIIDSGVQINHPDLRENIWENKKEIPYNNIDDDKNGFIDDFNGWDFVNNVADPSPKFKDGFTESGVLHGTIVAGVVGAVGNNNVGVTGITWKTKIMPLKVLDDKGEGLTSDVVRAIDYAIKNGADVINLSFVGFNYSKLLDDAIGRAYQAGVIVVAAAGNEHDGGKGYFLDDKPMYPACHDGKNGENRVIGVVATDALDQKAHFSSFGYQCVDIAAPGVSIFSTAVYAPGKSIGNRFFDKYYDGYWSGTSMATPMISAAIVLVSSVNPQLNNDEVVDMVLSTAKNINRLNPDYIDQLGSGRIDLYSAVSMAGNSLRYENEKLLLAPASAYKSLVRRADQQGILDDGFNAYGNNFLGGANLTSGDIDGDGENEIITGAGRGGGPHIRIFNQQGELKRQFFAYDANLRGGVNVTSCDIDGDGRDEVVTGAGYNDLPRVKILDDYGKVKNQFFAFDYNLRGGVNIDCGDVDGDGNVEIVVGAGRGATPQVRIFSNKGVLEGQFLAYDKGFRGGVAVALGDIDGGMKNKKLEIITAAGPGGGPHIRVFSNQGEVRGQFFAYEKSFRGGVNVSSGDINNDGLDEIVVAGAGLEHKKIIIFNYLGAVINYFDAFDLNFKGGINLGFIKLK